MGTLTIFLLAAILAVIPVPPGVSGVSSVDSSTFRDLVSDGTVGVIKCGLKKAGLLTRSKQTTKFAPHNYSQFHSLLTLSKRSDLMHQFRVIAAGHQTYQ